MAKHDSDVTATAIAAGANEMLPEIKMPLPGPKAKAIVERDHSVMSPSYTRDYGFVMERGEGAVVWDVDGNRFLDCAAGIAVCSTGHSHPHVVEAITRQAGKFLHMSGTDYYYELQPRLAERLTAYAPIEGPKRVFFTNSGAECVEGAIKLARYATGGHQMIAFLGAFHGRTLGALSLTASRNIQRRAFAPLMPGVVHVKYGESAENIDAVIKRIVDTDNFAALFVEAVQGEGGYIIPTAEWLQSLRELCDQYGILMVVDEVQSGMGRTGKMFAIEHFGVKPDVILAAKGIASGLPLGAIIAKADLMTWKPGMHGTTFGGNPVACAAANATIDLLEESLMENARVVGAHFVERLKESQERCPNIRGARGLGMMIAVDIVDDDGNPSAELRNRVVCESFYHGLLILGCGNNSIRFCPPLMLSREQADFAAATVEKVCRRLTGKSDHRLENPEVADIQD